MISLTIYSISSLVVKLVLGMKDFQLLQNLPEFDIELLSNKKVYKRIELNKCDFGINLSCLTLAKKMKEIYFTLKIDVSVF